VPHKLPHCSELAGGNWSCCWRDHKWHVTWQLTNVLFIYSDSMRLKDLILNMCSHDGHMHINSP
jgi:hypothetical protein